MFSIDAFISDSIAAATSREPRAALSQLLEQTITQADALLSCMPDTNDDETLLHVSDDLTIYHIRLPAGILYPPHDHRMPVIIGFYDGCETSLIYQQSSEGQLRQVDRLDFTAPCVATLEPDVIHAIGLATRFANVKADANAEDTPAKER